MAMQRNWVIMDAHTKDLDTVYAKGIDATLRFPGTRAAWIGKNRCLEGFFSAPEAGPKTYAMALRALEHDLQLIFSGQRWSVLDLVILSERSGMLNGLWHTRNHHRGGLYEKEEAYYVQAEALFRKHYKPKTVITSRVNDAGVCIELAIFAAHLKLPSMEFEGKQEMLRIKNLSIKESRISNPVQFLHENLKQTMQLRTGPGSCWDGWSGNLYLCIAFGDIEDVEKI